MSGHSKWSKVKHQKGPADIKRGLSFTKISNNITLSVRQGGGITNPEDNFRLRIAIEKAKEVNMPKENIQRAIERGLGKTGVVNLEEVTYEGFLPGGIAVLIQAATDNRLRTAAVVKNTLDSNNGSLAGPGAVAYNFKSRGVITLPKEGYTIDKILDLAIQAGGEDVSEEENSFMIFTQVEDLRSVREKLIGLGLKITSAEIYLSPINLVKVTDKETVNKIINTISKLEDLDDVLKVYSNIDMPDDLFSSLDL